MSNTIDRTLLGVTASGLRTPGGYGHERGTQHSPKLQHYRGLTIRLFNVISRTHVWWGPYISEVVQSVYSTADWVKHMWIKERESERERERERERDGGVMFIGWFRDLICQKFHFIKQINLPIIDNIFGRFLCPKFNLTFLFCFLFNFLLSKIKN